MVLELPMAPRLPQACIPLPPTQSLPLIAYQSLGVPAVPLPLSTTVPATSTVSLSDSADMPFLLRLSHPGYNYGAEYGYGQETRSPFEDPEPLPPGDEEAAAAEIAVAAAAIEAAAAAELQHQHDLYAASMAGYGEGYAQQMIDPLQFASGTALAVCLSVVWYSFV